MALRIRAIVCLVLLAAGCSETRRPAPPKVTTAAQFPVQYSTLAIPVDLSLDDIQRAIENSTPRRLWSIDQQEPRCVPAQRIRIFGARPKVTPDISCRIVGQVNRGAIRLAGKGQRLTLTMPISAAISARDVGGILKGETATGRAVVRADIRLGLDRSWQPTARVELSYDWTEPPGIDFLGQRIRFIRRADARLAGVVRGLERDLRRHVAQVDVRSLVAGAWAQGFTIVELNRDRPPAWMRITPRTVGLAGYGISGRKVALTVTAEALTETFVGGRPAAPRATPLPDQAVPAKKGEGLNFFVPVMADYAELEPVVLRALRKLAKKGIRLEGVGHIEAAFEKVTVYATSNGRLAVGVDARVEPVGDNFGTRFGKANGQVWLTGLPVNDANSRTIRIRDLEIFGGADRLAADLLIRTLSIASVRDEIAGSLVQNFDRDFDRVLAAARRAVGSRQQGAFRLTASIDSVHHGQVAVTGTGLFLPVTVAGRAAIAYRPAGQ